MLFRLLFLAIFAHASYQETLNLVPINFDKSLALFEFSLKWSGDTTGYFTNSEYFPIAIAQILKSSHADYFTASFTSGQYLNGTLEAIHKFNTFTNEDWLLPRAGFYLETSDRSSWRTLALQLGGLFCSFIASSGEPIPVASKLFLHNNDFLCKENFVRVQQLLPCKWYKGLGSILTSFGHSKYTNLVHYARRIDEGYEYRVRIIAEVNSKSPILQPREECNIENSARVRILRDNQIENHVLGSINFYKLRVEEAEHPIQFPIQSFRSLSGKRFEFEGTYRHKITNNLSSPLPITIFEYFPAVLTPFLSTLSSPSLPKISHFSFGTLLEFEFILDHFTTKEISIHLEKNIQQFELYPNDPQRGWDIPSMPLYFGVSNSTYFQSRLIAMIPEPDFSMPFNVMCITGSVIGFFITSLQTLELWKPREHWSSPFYEETVVKGERQKKKLKVILLASLMSVLVVLDYLGVLKLFG